MFLHGRNGKLHLFRYFTDRAFVHAAQDKYTPALRRQGFDRALDLTQFVTREYGRLGRPIFLRIIEIGDNIEAGNGIAPRRIDKNIACDTKEIGTAVADLVPVVRTISADQCLRHEIVEIIFR